MMNDIHLVIQNLNVLIIDKLLKIHENLEK